MGNGPCCGEEAYNGVYHGNDRYGTYGPVSPKAPSLVTSSKLPPPPTAYEQTSHLQSVLGGRSQQFNPDMPSNAYAKPADGLPNLPEVVVRAIEKERARRRR